MKMRRLALMLVLGSSLAASAAEVRVIAGPALAGVMPELGARFEGATGHRLVATYALSPEVVRRVAAGEVFDLAIAAPATIDELARQGKIVAASSVQVARVGMAVGSRQGGPMPDIASANAFKAALLNAQSVSFNPEGAVGRHLLGVLDRLEIAAQVKPKTKAQPGPEAVAKAIADGEAELGFAPANVLAATRNVQLVGPFPQEFQSYIIFNAALTTGAAQADAARALLKFLGSPEAATVFKAKALEPGAP